MAQAYAAGVGDWNPLYFNDDSPDGVLAPPCLVYRLQWNAREMPGAPLGTAPPTSYVHASTDLRFERPLRAGDVVTVQGRRIEVSQRPPGVYVVTRFEMRDDAGSLLATVDDGAIARGAHTDGPDVSLDGTPPLPRPTGRETGGWSVTVAIAREAPHVYTECADIWNPIHTERRVALAAGLPDIILQGSATMAIAARELVNRVASGDPARLARLAGQFRAMVIPGRKSALSAPEPLPTSERRTIAFFEVLNSKGEPAVKGGTAVFRPGAVFLRSAGGGSGIRPPARTISSICGASQRVTIAAPCRVKWTPSSRISTPSILRSLYSPSGHMKPFRSIDRDSIGVLPRELAVEVVQRLDGPDVEMLPACCLRERHVARLEAGRCQYDHFRAARRKRIDGALELGPGIGVPFSASDLQHLPADVQVRAHPRGRTARRQRPARNPACRKAICSARACRAQSAR